MSQTSENGKWRTRRPRQLWLSTKVPGITRSLRLQLPAGPIEALWLQALSVVREARSRSLCSGHSGGHSSALLLPAPKPSSSREGSPVQCLPLQLLGFSSFLAWVLTEGTTEGTHILQCGSWLAGILHTEQSCKSSWSLRVGGKESFTQVQSSWQPCLDTKLQACYPGAAEGARLPRALVVQWLECSVAG